MFKQAKRGDTVQYNIWTGLGKNVSRVAVVHYDNGSYYYDLENGDQLDDTSFTHEGAEVLSNQ
jgi:hypothetical protein